MTSSTNGLGLFLMIFLYVTFKINGLINCLCVFCRVRTQNTAWDVHQGYFKSPLCLFKVHRNKKNMKSRMLDRPFVIFSCSKIPNRFFPAVNLCTAALTNVALNDFTAHLLSYSFYFPFLSGFHWIYLYIFFGAAERGFTNKVELNQSCSARRRY